MVIEAIGNLSNSNFGKVHESWIELRSKVGRRETGSVEVYKMHLMNLGEKREINVQ